MGTHTDMEMPKTVKQNEVYTSSWTKEKEAKGLGLKGKECNSQEDEKE